MVQHEYAKGDVIAVYTYQTRGTKEKDIHVLLSDSKGSLKRAAVYLHPLNQDTEWIEPAKDGGFIVTGVTQAYHECDEDNGNIFVLGLDPMLNVLWCRTYDIID